MRKGGDFFNLITIISTVVLGAMAVYWVASLAFAGVALIFGVISAVGARLFRWPVKKIAIPLAVKLHIGHSRFGALLGFAVVAACVAVSLGIIREFNTPAVRRIGQGLYAVREQLGQVGQTFHSIAAEGIGNQRIDRIIDWVWQEDVSQDDTQAYLAKEDNRLPAALFSFSDRVNEWGRELMLKIYEGETHPWFLYAYWLVVSAVIPIMLATFIITIFQLSARRLLSEPGWFFTILTSLITLGLVYCLVAGFYLIPYVSHPYHTLGVPFWVATMVYVVAGSICCAVVRANQQVLFNPEETPKEFAAAGAKKKKK